SLVARPLWERKVVSSNLTVPTGQTWAGHSLREGKEPGAGGYPALGTHTERGGFAWVCSTPPASSSSPRRRGTSATRTWTTGSSPTSKHGATPSSREPWSPSTR